MQVVQRRGGFVEAVHPFSVAIVQSGQVVHRVGARVRPPMRSSAKPFQLACSLEALGDLEVTPEELAVGAASHTAEDEHLRLVQGLMQRFGVEPQELKCGGHPPLYRGADEARIRRGVPLEAIHNNCSGKHTFDAIMAVFVWSVNSCFDGNRSTREK